MDTLVALETGNNILGTSLLDNFIIPYNTTFQTACFQLQRNNRKHATVIWQLNVLRLCVRKRARSTKTCWPLIFDLQRSQQKWVNRWTHYSHKKQETISLALACWIILLFPIIMLQHFKQHVFNSSATNENMLQ